MRLLSQISREYNDTKYEKFWVVIPSKLVKQLGWKKGQELEVVIKEDKLVIEKD